MGSENVDSHGRHWRIGAWFPELGPDLISKLATYHAELIRFNGKMNLISPRTEMNADLVHLADGILGARGVFDATPSREIFDIGSGNGIPGLIMALLDPKRTIILVDSDARKIEFLKHCISKLELGNCKTIHARMEDLGNEVIHCAVSRGFASVSKSLLMCRRAAAKDCMFFHFKSQAWSTEVAEMPSQILAAWDPVHVSDYTLPDGSATMSLVLTRRVDRQ